MERNLDKYLAKDSQDIDSLSLFSTMFLNIRKEYYTKIFEVVE